LASPNGDSKVLRIDGQQLREKLESRLMKEAKAIQVPESKPRLVRP
jgi:hypothetical protein